MESRHQVCTFRRETVSYKTTTAITELFLFGEFQSKRLSVESNILRCRGHIVFIIPQCAGYHQIGTISVAGNRHIVHTTLAQQHLYIGLMRLRIEIIDKKIAKLILCCTTSAAISASPPSGPECIQVISAVIPFCSKASFTNVPVVPVQTR